MCLRHRNETVCLLYFGIWAHCNTVCFALRTALSQSCIDFIFFGPPTRTCELLKIVHVFFLSGQRQNKPKFAPAFTFAMKEKANKQLAKCTRTVCPLNCMYWSSGRLCWKSIGLLCLSTVLTIVKMHPFVCWCEKSLFVVHWIRWQRYSIRHKKNVCACLYVHLCKIYIHIYVYEVIYTYFCMCVCFLVEHEFHSVIVEWEIWHRNGCSFLPR
jgi:hypothetical protein